MKSHRPHVLITAVGAPPGLNALRALIETDRYEVFAADMNPKAPGLYQFGDQVQSFCLPGSFNESHYLAELERHIRSHKIEFILPCIEEEVLLLSRHPEWLQSLQVASMLPEQEVVALAADKAKTVEAAERAGLPHPASLFIPQRLSDEDLKIRLRDFESRTPLPWLIKPCFGHGMRGITKVHSQEQASTFLKSASRSMLVQEFIPGETGSMHLAGLLYDAAGSIQRVFTSRSISTLYAEGGPATAGISTDEPELISMSLRLIGELGPWRGPVNVEWMKDPRTNQFKLIEINPRLWGYGYLAVGSGVSFPDLTIRLGLGEDIGPDPGFRKGVTLIRTTHDLIFDSSPITQQLPLEQEK